MIEDIDTSIKIIVVGNGMVGKTTMTVRFAKNIFTNEYKKTLGVDFLQKSKYINAIDKKVEFFLWDTAGQDYYDAITRRYYKGANGALVLFSMTDRASFDNARKWRDKVTAECDNIPILLIMSKTDLIDQAVVTEQEAMDLAKELKLKLYKVSSKDNQMVSEVFETLAIQHFKNGGVSSEPQSIEQFSKKNSFKQNEIKEVEVLKPDKKIVNGFMLNKQSLPQKNEHVKKKKPFCSVL